MGKNQTHSKVYGYILCWLTGGLAISISVLTVPFIIPGFRKFSLPYIPATNIQIQNLIQLLIRNKLQSPVIDLGSGDGRIAFTLSSVGMTTVGVELNPCLYWFSLFKKYIVCDNKVHFYKKDLWKINLSDYKGVIIFGIKEMMLELENKLQTELPEDGYVMTSHCKLPTWVVTDYEGHGFNKICLYKKRVNILRGK